MKLLAIQIPLVFAVVCSPAWATEGAGLRGSEINYGALFSILFCLVVLLVLRRRQIKSTVKDARAYVRLVRVLAGSYAAGGILWILALVIGSMIGVDMDRYFPWILGGGMLLAFPFVYKFMA